VIRVNAALVLAVLGTAFALVNTQYQSRRLYNAVDQASAVQRQLASDFESLRVQRRAEAAPGRVQHLATTRLNMRAPDPSITQYVTHEASTDALAHGEPEVGGQ
jgi:cell division protein FtsL